MKFLLAIALCVTVLFAFSYGAEVCYEPCGCFNDDPPFDDRPLPEGHSPTEMDLKWLLYTQSNQNIPVEITINSDDSVDIPDEFNPNNPTKFLIHGWNSGTSTFDSVREAYMSGYDYNLILVDWSIGAGRALYPQSASNTQVVGACSAYVAEQLDDDGVLDEFHCIGHSLGGQTCGYMGKNGNQLARISGLDPAGPLFDEKDASVRLDAADCDFMDNIHTNAEGDAADLGMRTAVGDVDFYPNKGGRQDGCNNANCDHGICKDYFAESIGNRDAYPSCPCNSDVDADAGNCNSCSGNDEQYMGDPAIEYSATGTFYRDMATAKGGIARK